MTALNIDDCINETCPWPGKPVQANSLALYGDDVVGFCNPGCRDKFESAVRHFEEARVSSGAGRGAHGRIDCGEGATSAKTN